MREDTSYNGFDYCDNLYGYPHGDIKITCGAASAPFVPGEVVLGGTSGAFGILGQFDSSNKAWILTLSGTFQNAELLTGSQSGSTATGSGAAIVATPGNAAAYDVTENPLISDHPVFTSAATNDFSINTAIAGELPTGWQTPVPYATIGVQS
jgi:hypothetical protein